jgi:hypothetical protein
LSLYRLSFSFHKGVMDLHYKFVSNSHAVPYLLKGSIKFTPIKELNDPSELTSNFILSDVLDSLSRLRRDGYSEEDLFHLKQQGKLLARLSPGSLAVHVPPTREQANWLIRSSFYDQTHTLERLLERTANEMSQKVGLFCVSKRFDSLPMWAHYSANAAGLVVEFRGLNEVFQGDQTGILNQLVTVRYNRKSTGVTFDPRSHESLFFEKFDDWDYEQEVRIVRPLDDCKALDSEGTRLYLHEIPKECISRLILGWRMEPGEAANIREQARSCSHPVAVVEAGFKRGQIELSK